MLNLDLRWFGDLKETPPAHASLTPPPANNLCIGWRMQCIQSSFRITYVDVRVHHNFVCFNWRMQCIQSRIHKRVSRPNHLGTLGPRMSCRH